MIEKSPETPCFRRLAGAPGPGRTRVESLPTTASPWGSDSQHGGRSAALLERAIEQVADGVVGRFTSELLGPVPVGPLSVSARVERPGRSVRRVDAETTLADGSVGLATSAVHDARGPAARTNQALLVSRR